MYVVDRPASIIRTVGGQCSSSHNPAQWCPCTHYSPAASLLHPVSTPVAHVQPPFQQLGPWLGTGQGAAGTEVDGPIARRASSSRAPSPTPWHVSTRFHIVTQAPHLLRCGATGLRVVRGCAVCRGPPLLQPEGPRRRATAALALLLPSCHYLACLGRWKRRRGRGTLLREDCTHDDPPVPENGFAAGCSFPRHDVCGVLQVRF